MCVFANLCPASVNINSFPQQLKWKLSAPSDTFLCKCGAGCLVCVRMNVIPPHWTATEITQTHLQQVTSQFKHYWITQHFFILSILSCISTLKACTELHLLLSLRNRVELQRKCKAQVLSRCYRVNPVLFLFFFLRELKGVVVSLSSDGHFLCSYMGTDPSFFSTPKVDAREADYEQIDAEMKKLQKFIREATRTQGERIQEKELWNALNLKQLPDKTGLSISLILLYNK